MKSFFRRRLHPLMIVVPAVFLFWFPGLISGFLSGPEGPGGPEGPALWAQQNPFLSDSAPENQGDGAGSFSNGFPAGSQLDDDSAADPSGLGSAPQHNNSSLSVGSSPSGNSSGSVNSSPPGRAPGLLMSYIISLQRELYSRLASLMGGIKSSGSNPRFLFMLLLGACVYGMLHALGPGHRKTVIFSYFLAEDARLLRGITAGVTMALLHGASAVGLILPLYYLIRGSLLVTFNSLSRYIELGTFLFISLFGAVMLVRHLIPHLKKKKPGSAVSADGMVRLGAEELDPLEPVEAVLPADPTEPARFAEPARRPHGLLLLIIGSGLVPCPGAAMILIFALSMGMVMTGVLAVAAMSLGMALTLSLVAVLSLGARGGLEKSTRRNRRTAVVVHELLELGGYGLITIFGLVMALGMV